MSKVTLRACSPRGEFEVEQEFNRVQDAYTHAANALRASPVRDTYYEVSIDGRKMHKIRWSVVMEMAP